MAQTFFLEIFTEGFKEEKFVLEFLAEIQQALFDEASKAEPNLRFISIYLYVLQYIIDDSEKFFLENE